MQSKHYLSNHAVIRCQQRGLDPTIVDYLIGFGIRSYCRKGCRRYCFNRESRARLQHEMPHQDYVRIEPKLYAFAVVAADGMVITVGHQIKRIRH